MAVSAATLQAPFIPLPDQRTKSSVVHTLRAIGRHRKSRSTPDVSTRRPPPSQTKNNLPTTLTPKVDAGNEDINYDRGHGDEDNISSTVDQGGRTTSIRTFGKEGKEMVIENRADDRDDDADNLDNEHGDEDNDIRSTVDQGGLTTSTITFGEDGKGSVIENRADDRDDDADDPDNEDDIRSRVDQSGLMISAISTVERDKGEAMEYGDDDPDDHADDHDHNSDGREFSCSPPYGGLHSEFIQARLEILKKKCSEFEACLTELYSAENYHLLLSGSNLQLKNICGLMYPNGGGEYTTLVESCSDTERKAIRQDIGKYLDENLLEPPDDRTSTSWKKLDQCLKNNSEPSVPPIDTVCRLKKNSTVLCHDRVVDEVTEDFFNHQLQHLHCSCAAITSDTADEAGSSSIPLAVKAGVAGGVLGLLLVLIAVVVVLCIRHRKVKRKLEQHRMRYLPSAQDDTSAIYQEVNDYPQSLETLRKDRDQGILPSGYQFLGPAPSLPERYVKDVSRSRPNLAQSPSGDDHEYLEPLSGPEVNTYNKLAGGGNIKAENQYELARPPDSTSPTGVPAPPGVKPRGDGTYFARIDVAKDGADEDGGYSTLGRKVADGEGGGGGQADPAETEPLTTAPLSGGGERTGGDEPKYYVLEPENPTEHDAHTTTTTQL